jgi:hypothetical protein
MGLRFLALLGVLALVGCSDPLERDEDLIPPSELIQIEIVPGPPELTFEQKLAAQGAVDAGVMDLSLCVWPTQAVTFYIAPPAQVQVEVMPVPYEEPLRASAETPVVQEAREDAPVNNDYQRGYVFAKRLAVMDARYCRNESETFIRGCQAGMLDDQAEFKRDYR